MPLLRSIKQHFYFWRCWKVFCCSSRSISGAVAGEEHVKIISRQRAYFWSLWKVFWCSSRSISCAVAGEERSRSIQVGLTNSSPAFTFFANCLSFSSPPLHICRFYFPFSFAFSFALFSRLLSVRLCAMCLHYACIFSC